MKAAAIARDRVRVLFEVAQPRAAQIEATASYIVTSLQGVALPIGDVSIEQATGAVSSVVLALTTPLGDESHYQLKVTLPGLTATTVFQSVQSPLQTTIALSVFTGQVTGNILGEKASVFVSPAFDVPVANSTIQLEEVEICARPDDTYVMPQESSFAPVFTTYDPRLPVAPLNSGASLAGKTLLGPARADLGWLRRQTLPATTDDLRSAELFATWDPAYVGLLNNPWWTLNQGANPKRIFITANNLAPIPEGDRHYLIEPNHEDITVGGEALTIDGDAIWVYTG